LRPEISAVIIAKNESRSIKRCIDSVIAYVDQVVVLDTGSTDDTVEIALSSGAKVYQDEWKNDFSLARNTVLKHADSNWNLIIDADEWVHSGAESLHDLIKMAPFLGVVSIRNYYESTIANSPATMATSWITRFLPRGVLYEGVIHEQPRSNLSRIRVPLVLGHDGYQKNQAIRKVGRNRKLLELELVKYPANSYLLYQLAKDYEISEDFSAACKYYELAKFTLQDNASYHHDLLVRYLYSLSKKGSFDEALQLAGELFEELSDSPDFFFVYGNLLLDCAVSFPQEAFDKWLPLAEMSWIRCLEIGDRPDLDGSVVGRGSYIAAYNLSVLYDGAGLDVKAKEYREISNHLISIIES
jgi:glycosyltransferase involved in cell wall biosynthesis